MRSSSRPGARTSRGAPRQLAVGGRLVIPVGEEVPQLVRARPRGDEQYKEDLGGVRFVPLIGAEGWCERDGAGTGAAPPVAPTT